MNISQVQKKSKLLRINRFLALNLNISRRDSDTLVEKKNVKINGKIAQHGDSVDEDDIVMFKNEVVQPTSEHEYYLFYKPYGYVSSHKRQGEKGISQRFQHNLNLSKISAHEKIEQAINKIMTNFTTKSALRKSFHSVKSVAPPKPTT